MTPTEFITSITTIQTLWIATLAIYSYKTRENVRKLQQELNDLREDASKSKETIDHALKVALPTTKLEKATVKTSYFLYFEYVCRVCGHQHKTPVPKCWGCGREVSNYDDWKE